MLMKRLMNWRPLVKSLFLLSLHYTFVTRRWKDLSMFHYWIQQFPTWSPLDHQDWGKFKIFLRFVCKFCLRWDEENWINMDRNVSLIILIIVTRRKRYLSPACCLWYWQRKKFIQSEKRLYDKTSGCKKLNKRDAFAFKNVRYISPYLRLICLWNFQGGSNNNRISDNGTPRRGAGLFTNSFYYISGRSLNFLLPSVFWGYKFPSSNRDHWWQSFLLIQWTSKKFYIIIFVFFERKKNE